MPGRTDTFCLAASLAAGGRLAAPGRRAGKRDRKSAAQCFAPFLANKERSCGSTVAPSLAFDMIL